MRQYIGIRIWSVHELICVLMDFWYHYTVVEVLKEEESGSICENLDLAVDSCSCFTNEDWIAQTLVQDLSSIDRVHS